MNNVLKWVGITIGGSITIMILMVIGVNIFVPEEELVKVRKQAEAKAARKQFLKDSTEKAQARMDSLAAIEAEKMELQGMDEEESTLKALGENGIIKITTPGCLKKADFEEVMKLAGANDRLGIDQMEKDGIVVPLYPGIKGKKIDSGFGWEQIRITEGELKGLAFYTFGGSLER